MEIQRAGLADAFTELHTGDDAMRTATMRLNFAGSMPGARMFRTYLTEAKYKLLRALRSPAFAIPFLTLPVALYFLFGVLLAGSMSHGDHTISKIMFVNFSIFGIMGPGMFGFGMFVANERSQGLLTLKRALPMPPASYLIAKMAMTVAFSAIVMVTVIGVAATMGHTGLSAGQFLEVALIDIVGSLPFAAIGLFIGTIASQKRSCFHQPRLSAHDAFGWAVLSTAQKNSNH